MNGSIVRGISKAAPDIRRLSGPAAGGGYVLRKGPKVKVPRACGFKRFGRISLAGPGPLRRPAVERPNFVGCSRAVLRAADGGSQFVIL